MNDREDRFVGTSESDPEHWLLDWLTAGQLPRFNRKGTLRVVQRTGLGAWLAGVEPGFLRAARDRALSQWEAMRQNGIQAVVLGHKGYPFGLHVAALELVVGSVASKSCANGGPTERPRRTRACAQ